jgi:hypothetical protein
VASASIDGPTTTAVDAERDEAAEPLDAVLGRPDHGEAVGEVAAERARLGRPAAGVHRHVVGTVDLGQHALAVRVDRRAHPTVHDGEPGEGGDTAGGQAPADVRVVVDDDV